MAFLTEDQLKGMSFRRLGRNVRISDKASIYNMDQIEIGDNSRIDDFCVVSGRVTIGRNVHVAVFCNVAGGAEGVTLADFSGLAYGCYVFSQSDDYTGLSMSNPTVPARYKKETRRAVLIGRHCIVGAKSLVLPGVTMAEGGALGAMSMLTKSTEAWAVYFGIPAKKIKKRKKDLLELEQEYLSAEQGGQGE
jgi:acetyltransferase-like isoleucine patch superfamily enzyme